MLTSGYDSAAKSQVPGQLGSAPNPVVTPETIAILNRLDDLSNLANTIANRSNDVADRMFGSLPDIAETAECNPPSSGQINAIHDAIGRVSTILRRADSSLERLSRL